MYDVRADREIIDSQGALSNKDQFVVYRRYTQIPVMCALQAPTDTLWNISKYVISRESYWIWARMS